MTYYYYYTQSVPLFDLGGGGVERLYIWMFPQFVDEDRPRWDELLSICKERRTHRTQSKGQGIRSVENQILK